MSRMMAKKKVLVLDCSRYELDSESNLVVFTSKQARRDYIFAKAIEAGNYSVLGGTSNRNKVIEQELVITTEDLDTDTEEGILIDNDTAATMAAAAEEKLAKKRGASSPRKPAKKAVPFVAETELVDAHAVPF